MYLLTLGIGDTRLGLSVVLGAPEQHDVWLGSMDRVMHPSARLLNANASPLGLAEKATLGKQSCNLCRKHYVPVLEDVVVVFFGVLDLVMGHRAG